MRNWTTIKEYDEILFEQAGKVAKITINRPHVHNAFTPKTVMEMIDAFNISRDKEDVGVIILTGAGDQAFCSGGDQKVRGNGGYVGEDNIPRLNVLDLQRLIRVIPKPVIAMVKGWSIGGGNVLQLVCDLTIAAENAKFGQTGPNVGSFDGGYGSGYLARVIGHKKAKEVWFMCKQYSAQEALDMGWINTVVPLDQVEDVTMEWAEEMLTKSPIALRMIKASLNADTDGLAGVQQLAGDATLFTIQWLKHKKAEMHLKKNGHQISINSLNSHKPMTWLNKQVQKRPDHPAFYFQDESWTFLEVQQEVSHWVATYQQVLAPEEKRVALFSKNSKELYFSILALWELGKELLFLNTHLTLAELTFQLKDAQVKTIIGAPETQALLEEISFVDVQPMVKKQHSLSHQEFQQPSDLESVASIMYTSGTTGQPKGVLQRFKNHLASARGTQENMGITAEDCWLCAVPLFHISGLSIVVRQLVLGCSIRLYDKFDEQQVTQDLQEGRGTVISVVATMLQQLLSVYPEAGYSASFKGMLLGGGPIAPDKLAQCEEKGIPVIQSYGMTETCSQVVALKFEDAALKIGSAGQPLKDMQIKIVDELGQEQPEKQVGEILLKGPNVVSGYLNQRQPEKWTADGWFKTGDMGYLDAQGYLYLVSRLSELIISGGENIYPTEVEQVLQAITGIKAAAVVGEPDAQWGAVPVAYVISDQEITLAQIQDQCSRKLAKYKRPKRIYFCHSFPQTASGKIAKHRFMTEEREAFLIR